MDPGVMIATDLTGAGLFELNLSTGVVSECFYKVKPKDDSPWKIVNPLIEAAPLLTQLGLMIFLIRALFLLFNLVRLPRFLAELITAIITGATVLGKQDWFVVFLTPHIQTQAIETLANLGLIYYMFLVGLEMDLTTLRRIEKKVICNVVAGILFPLVAGIGLYYLIILEFLEGKMAKTVLGPFFLGASLTVTSFPDLARILSDLKILNTDVGRMALSSAFLNDLFTWIFVVVTMGYLHGQGGRLSVIPTFIFLIICWFGIRPILSWTLPDVNSGNFSDPHIYYIFIAVLAFGLIADACGTHSMVGAFMFGVIMPKGEIITMIGEKLEEFATGILLPFFFLTVGFRTNLFIMPIWKYQLAITVLLACSFKVMSTFVVALFFGMSAREGFTLGVLMNTKGILAIIIVNLGLESEALHIQLCLVMVIVFMAMSIMVKPIPFLVYSPANRFKEYNQRTIENTTDCSEFRVLLCIHGVHNVAGMTNLLEYSNSTKQSPIVVVAALLVELVGRATAMLIVHGNRSVREDDDYSVADRDKDKSDLITAAMKEFGQKGRVGSVQPLTVVSPFDTMHEDIYNLAEDKFSNLILIPFNKSSTSLRKLSQNLLKRAPCSLGLLLDRGLGLVRSADEDNQQRQQLKVAMFFCGGPDGREALAYSYRMAGSQDVELTVVRFIPGKEAEDMVEDAAKFASEQEMDDRYANEFKFRTMCDSSITYIEKVVNTGNDIMTSISNLFGHFHLCIVGRGQGMISPFLIGLSEWIEFEELGPLGDALSASVFAEHASILILQKYE